MKLESFHQFILPEVVGCPAPIIDRAVIDATRDFCDRTFSWRETSTQTLIKGITEYEADISSKTDVVRVLRVEANGVSHQNLGQHFNHNPFSDAGWGSTHPTYTFTIPKSITLTVEPPEKIANGLTIEVAIKPQYNVTTIDDDLFHRWREPMVLKAKQLLFIQPGMAWTNNELAAFYHQMYSKAIAPAAAESRREYAFKDLANPEISPVW
jgi:hypothetical protein